MSWTFGENLAAGGKLDPNAPWRGDRPSVAEEPLQEGHPDWRPWSGGHASPLEAVWQWMCRQGVGGLSDPEAVKAKAAADAKAASDKAAAEKKAADDKASADREAAARKAEADRAAQAERDRQSAAQNDLRPQETMSDVAGTPHYDSGATKIG